jgi:hypothetical protein
MGVMCDTLLHPLMLLRTVTITIIIGDSITMASVMVSKA